MAGKTKTPEEAAQELADAEAAAEQAKVDQAMADAQAADDAAPPAPSAGAETWTAEVDPQTGVITARLQ